MKSGRIQKIVATIAITILTFTASNSWALPPMSRERCGIVGEISHANRTFALIHAMARNRCMRHGTAKRGSSKRDLFMDSVHRIWFSSYCRNLTTLVIFSGSIKPPKKFNTTKGL